MRKLTIILSIICCVFLISCATSKITTDVGVTIGESYQEAVEKGAISAEQSIKAWPYISGQIKGLLSANYNIDIPPLATQIIDKLDKIAAQDKITLEQKGFIIGSFVRLEKIAIEHAWDKYGVSIFNLVLTKVR